VITELTISTDPAVDFVMYTLFSDATAVTSVSAVICVAKPEAAANASSLPAGE
jgi:hypothetical protein